ncbi:hypothetical protein ASF23_14790 [Curtobacterium sp. Leaf261]|nr:hypothetical protein ASF23_14790 [Curtobacterium sp. Leaf261]
MAAAESDLNGLDDMDVVISTAISDALHSTASKAMATASALSMLGTDPFEIDLASTNAHITTAIESTRSAITAYEHGDSEMARHYDGLVDPK